MDNKIDFLSANNSANCSPNKAMIEGCAGGISYLVLICDNDCGVSTSIKYLNTSTGLVEDSAPANFSLGNCSELAVNSAGAPDWNPVPINYTPSASGNTQNLNSFVIDPNGDLYFIDIQGEAVKMFGTETLTSVVDNGDGTFTYTDEAGNETIVDLSSCFANAYTEKVTEIVFNADGTASYFNEEGEEFIINQFINVISTVEETPNATGNTENLNSIFKDANNDTWIVDYLGNAIKAGSAGTSGAPVTVSTSYPVGTAVEGSIHLVTDDGTPTGTVLQQFIYDVESGVWIEMQRNAQNTLKFGTDSPTSNGEWDGEEFFVTSDGTSAGAVLEQWIWDKQTEVWVQRPEQVASASALWTDAVVNPYPTGNTGTLPRFVYNTVNNTKWYIDANGVAKQIDGAEVATGQNVYFDSTDPASGTIFDAANPPVINNDALKEDSANTYYGIDGSVWTWNGTSYVTKTYNFPLQQLDADTIATAGQTAFNLTKIPIGNVWIYRNGVRLSASAISWVGTAVTYIPANNGGKTMDAGDRVEFEYEAY